jgi:hypothetical protein
VPRRGGGEDFVGEDFVGEDFGGEDFGGEEVVGGPAAESGPDLPAGAGGAGAADDAAVIGGESSCGGVFAGSHRPVVSSSRPAGSVNR